MGKKKQSRAASIRSFLAKHEGATLHDITVGIGEAPVKMKAVGTSLIYMVDNGTLSRREVKDASRNTTVWVYRLTKGGAEFAKAEVKALKPKAKPRKTSAAKAKAAA